MGSARNDFAVLLAAPDPTESDLARDLLASAGIPSMLHGQDRDFAELGAAGHRGVARPDLLVPKSALERARALLAEAWDRSSLTDEMATATPPREEESPPARRSGTFWLLFAFFVAVAVVVTWMRFRSSGTS